MSSILTRPAMTVESISAVPQLQMLSLFSLHELTTIEDSLLARWHNYKSEGRSLKELADIENEINMVWREQFRRFQENKDVKPSEKPHTKAEAVKDTVGAKWVKDAVRFFDELIRVSAFSQNEVEVILKEVIVPQICANLGRDK